MENLGLHIDYLGPEKSQAKWMADSQELSKTLQKTGIVNLIQSQKQ